MSNEEIKRRQTVLPILICVVGIVLNVGGGQAANFAGLPLYCDTAGTILAAFLGGYIPGITAALLTNMINFMSDEVSIYYGALNVLVAIITAYVARRGYLKNAKSMFVYILSLALVSGGVGGFITWALTGSQFSESDNVMAFLMRWDRFDTFGEWYALNLLVNFVDKLVAVAVGGMFINAIPRKYWPRFELTKWLQNPISEERMAKMRSHKLSFWTMNKKIVVILTIFSLILVMLSTGISLKLFRNYSIHQHEELALGIAQTAASVIDGDSVDRYLNLGGYSNDYRNTQKLLKSLLENTPEVQYIYAYKILADGCHVVFDVDSNSVAASNLGDVIPFDAGFADVVPDLLEGKPINPIITDDTYGWLLTAYQPVYDSEGTCVCYAAVDISMDNLLAYEKEMLAKLFGIFSGFFFLALAVVIWLVKYDLIMPIDSMAYAASKFRYGDEFERKRNVQELSKLGIETGNEIQNLYDEFLHTTEESTRYFEENKQKLDKIDELQKVVKGLDN
ncbi:MAG: hypothetical protein J5622_00275 [Firmicutes bacterium]|nr:hypothetical protein [Bacillota bacterium]